MGGMSGKAILLFFAFNPTSVLCRNSVIESRAGIQIHRKNEHVRKVLKLELTPGKFG